MTGSIRVGTSGYSFADWIGPFYTPGLPRNRMLEEYVTHFGVVEINASYYRIPGANMFARMEEKTPAGFEFIVKLFRGMTHEIEDDASMFADFIASVADSLPKEIASAMEELGLTDDDLAGVVRSVTYRAYKPDSGSAG